MPESGEIGRGTPIVAVDVDGVLNPDDPHLAARLGSQPHRYDGPDPSGRPVTGTVWLHPDHGAWLRELAEHAEPVWCTSWNQLAAVWIAPRLGLPDSWPHVPVRGGGVRFGHQSKLADLYSWAGRRPLAVLDDESAARTRPPPSSAPLTAHPPCCGRSTRTEDCAAPTSTPSWHGCTTCDPSRSINPLRVHRSPPVAGPRTARKGATMNDMHPPVDQPADERRNGSASATRCSAKPACWPASATPASSSPAT